MYPRKRSYFRRHSLGWLVMAVWAGTMLVLFRQYADHGHAALDGGDINFFHSVEAAPRWKDVDEWMVLVQSSPGRPDQVLGGSKIQIRRLDDPTTGTAYGAEFALQGKFSALVPTATIRGNATIDADSNLTGYFIRGDLAGLQLSSQGAVLNDILYAKINNMAQTTRLKQRLDSPVSFGELLRPALSRRMKIAVGEKMSSPVIDPLTGVAKGKVVVTIEAREPIELGGESVPAYRVVSQLGDIKTVMWVDAEGQTLRRKLVNGIRMDRSDRQTALKAAPLLDTPVAAPEMDFSEFRNVPMRRQGQAPEEASWSVLGSILQ